MIDVSLAASDRADPKLHIVQCPHRVHAVHRWHIEDRLDSVPFSQRLERLDGSHGVHGAHCVNGTSGLERPTVAGGGNHCLLPPLIADWPDNR